MSSSGSERFLEDAPPVWRNTMGPSCRLINLAIVVVAPRPIIPSFYFPPSSELVFVQVLLFHPPSTNCRGIL
jgi:hypothetical protein